MTIRKIIDLKPTAATMSSVLCGSATHIDRYVLWAVAPKDKEDCKKTDEATDQRLFKVWYNLVYVFYKLTLQCLEYQALWAN